MLSYIKDNYQFVVLTFLWVIAGYAGGALVGVAVVVGSVLLFKYKLLFEELFIGFILIQIFSDSRQHWMSFASDAKTAYVLLLAAFFFFDRRKFHEFNRLVFLFFPFLFLALVLVFASDAWINCLQKTISYSLLLIIVPNYVIKIYEEKGMFFFKNLIFCLTLILFIGILLKPIWPSVIASYEGRFNGLFGNPNGIGLFCSIFFLLVCTVEYYFKDIFSKWEKAFVYGVIFLSVILCSSRTSIMCILIYYFFLRISKISPYLSFLIFIVVLSSYQLLFSNLPFIIKTLGLGDYFRITTLEGGSGRDVAWKYAWEKIQENFFLGKGFVNDEMVFYSDEAAARLSILGHQGNAHNSYLTLWLNTGIIGLFLFARGFLLAFLKGAKNTRIALPIMFSLLFSANYESWMAASLNPFTIQLWIILTLLTSPQFNEDKNESTIPVH